MPCGRRSRERNHEARPLWTAGQRKARPDRCRGQDPRSLRASFPISTANIWRQNSLDKIRARATRRCRSFAASRGSARPSPRPAISSASASTMSIMPMRRASPFRRSRSSSTRRRTASAAPTIPSSCRRTRPSSIMKSNSRSSSASAPRMSPSAPRWTISPASASPMMSRNAPFKWTAAANG